MEGFQEIVSVAPAGGSAAEALGAIEDLVQKQANKTARRRRSNLSRRVVFGAKHNLSNHFYRDLLSNMVEGKTRCYCIILLKSFIIAC